MNFLFSFAKGAKVYLRGIDEKFLAKSKSINVDCTQYKLEENVFYESLPLFNWHLYTYLIININLIVLTVFLNIILFTNTIQYLFYFYILIKIPYKTQQFPLPNP